MKKIRNPVSRISYGLISFFVAVFLCTIKQSNAVSWLNVADPYPVYTSFNPLGAWTYWEECDPEYYYLFSASVFRQAANAGRSGPFTMGSCPPISTLSTTGTAGTTCACVNSNGCQATCNTDVSLGSLHGPWNMIALLYDEANGNHIIRDTLICQLNLCNPAQTGLGAPGSTPTSGLTCTNPGSYTTTQNILAGLILPELTDPNQNFGFFDVPIEYRKYGIRIQADIGFWCNFGLRIQAGVASIRQVVQFNDLTCGTVAPCSTYSPGTTTCVSGACPTSTNPLIVNSCAQQLVLNGIMSEQYFIADLLGLNIRDFCDTNLEDLTLNLYWSHCFEYNWGKVENECWPHYTIAPYVMGEFTFPLTHGENPNRVFALPFGNNGHYGLGLAGGFTLNFIETVEIGVEAGFTHFNKRVYCDYPVPTNDLQEGMFPRKANLCLQPGDNWTFTATLGAHHFLSCLSCYVQFVGIHHCKNDFCILQPIQYIPPSTMPAVPLPCAGTSSPCTSTTISMDMFVPSNIRLQKMKDESEWNTNFVDVSFTYDISKHTQLGFFWQAPVRQEFAYRSTTVMLSLMFDY